MPVFDGSLESLEVARAYKEVNGRETSNVVYGMFLSSYGVSFTGKQIGS